MPKPTLSFLFLALVLLAPLPAQTYGALGNPTGRPIGGGEAYGDWISAFGSLGQPAQRVSTASQLVSALTTATPGTVVYVDDNAEIDVSGLTLPVTAGVTLASGRGRAGSLGGLLYSIYDVASTTLQVQGTGVRITGLRLRGPDVNIHPADCGEHDAEAIAVDAGALGHPQSQWYVRIDNNEIWGWPHAGVRVADTLGVQVQHNHIHHNRRSVVRSGCTAYGLGYGVAVDYGGCAIIEANLFDHNRHHIASRGDPGTVYEARYNIALPSDEHAFDVHGGVDRNDNTNIAGTLFWVHHNTFLQDDEPSFRIRGVPQLEARVYNNEFMNWSAYGAANQINAYGNFYVYDNLLNVNRLPAWFVSYSGTPSTGSSFWRLRRLSTTAMSTVKLADFNGDHVADAFTVVNGQWLLSDRAIGDWHVINNLPVSFSQLRFGDFNGDGRTDVFRLYGSQWQVSYSGTGPWTTINTLPVALGSLGFADFNGDGRTDVFYGNGSTWQVSWGGTSPWRYLNTANNFASNVAFGDFNGDHRDDVFWVDGNAWRVSWGGTSMWQTINGAGTPLSNMAFADIDGDGRTDVFWADGSQWRVSYAGTSYWTTIQHSSLTTSQLRLGDVNGDRKADVLSCQSSDG
ncbi:MAG TPA: VCBS repeat-containing protein [Planctomycetota bacterium]|nr:VCBS repeat-containing protein [Planctomycetota bacterium]